MRNSVATDRPLFQEAADELPQTRPISGWAVLSLIIGVSCLLVPISLALLPLSILAISLGWFLSTRLARPDADLGRWMANVCLGMGVASATWSLVAYKANANYLSRHASQYASELVELIAAGKLYHAMELSLPMGQRQQPDVDLQAYYEAYQGDISAELSAIGLFAPAGGERNPEKDRKVGMVVFRQNPVTGYIQENSQAKWSYVGLKELKQGTDSVQMQVVLQCSEAPLKQVVIEVLRKEAPSTDSGRSAEWRIGRLAFAS